MAGRRAFIIAAMVLVFIAMAFILGGRSTMDSVTYLDLVVLFLACLSFLAAFLFRVK